MIAFRPVVRGLTVLACCFLVCGLVQPVGSATLVVDDDGGAAYTSIQPAIDAAVSGRDDVFVRCGTYFENIVLRDGVSVSGEGAECTTLDGSADDQAVVHVPSLGADTVFQGFTVRNRHSLRPGTQGISVETGSPVISYNIIRGDYDCCWGGGIVLDGSWVGGGIAVSGPAGIVANNVIAFNTAEICGAGILDWGLVFRFESNDVFGDQPDNYSGNDLIGTDGNISLAPLFVDLNERSFAGFEPRNVSPLLDLARPSGHPTWTCEASRAPSTGTWTPWPCPTSAPGRTRV